MSTFNPSPSAAEQILMDLCSPDATLRDIALRASTTLDDLCLWMNLPDIAARLAAIQSAMFVKARLTAANHLPFIAHAAAELVRSFLSEERGEARADPKLRCRTREAARKAMHLLLRLARMTPHPPPPGPVPSPRAGEGSGPPVSSAPSSSPPAIPAPSERERSPLPFVACDLPPPSLPTPPPSPSSPARGIPPPPGTGAESARRRGLHLLLRNFSAAPSPPLTPSASAIPLAYNARSGHTGV